MTVNIGIFQKQEDVVEAIRLLREAGLDHDDIRVIVKNAENAPLIASNTDVLVEDLTGIQDARNQDSSAQGIAPLGLAGIPANTGMGTSTQNGYPGALIMGAMDDDQEDADREQLLRDIGIPGHASERCEEEVGAGRYLVLTETGDDTNANSILRHAGAADVLH
jgi:hypothetical protein